MAAGHGATHPALFMPQNTGLISDKMLLLDTRKNLLSQQEPIQLYFMLL